MRKLYVRYNDGTDVTFGVPAGSGVPYPNVDDRWAVIGGVDDGQFLVFLADVMWMSAYDEPGVPAQGVRSLEEVA